MFPGFDRHEILKAHYRKEILGWDWKGLVAGMELQPGGSKHDEPVLSNWIGTVTGIMPSGKIYTFWTSNQTSSDQHRDEAFRAALEEIAEEHGCYVLDYDDSLYLCAEPKFHVETWFERDRAHVELKEEKTDATLIDLWDEDVSQAIEDGFVDPRDYEGSLVDYWKHLRY